jgi:ABC-type Fe3+-hydroxamate transport system substrate-binding protein
MGRILTASQMFEPHSRRIAIVFENEPHTVYVYFFWPEGCGFFGRKDYAGDAANQVTGVAIAQRKLFVVL